MLYDQNITFDSGLDYNYFEGQKKNTSTFSLISHSSFLLIDHFKRDTFLLHNDPNCNSLFGKPYIGQVNDNFIEAFINSDDLELFNKIIEVTHKAIRDNFLKGDKYFFFFFDFPLYMSKRKGKRYKFTITPLLYAKDNKPWVTWYSIEPSGETTGGTLTLQAIRQEVRYHYDFEKKEFYKDDKIWCLSEIERTILQLSAEGQTEKQIANEIGMNIGSLKNTKLKIFEKMNVSTIYAAIAKAFKQGVID